MDKIFGSLLVLLVACDPVQGTEGDACYPNDTCDDGLVCLSNLCVSLPDASPPDGSQPDGSQPDGSQPDALSPFVCNDDGAIDDNNTPATATPTPIPELRNDYELIGLSICPDYDLDIYHFRVPVTGQSIRLDIRYRPEYGELILELLDADGLSITAGVVTGPYPFEPELVVKQVQVSDVPAGTYYAMVRAPSGVQNNYSIFIQISDP